MVVPDQQECVPVSVLRESELAWVTRYVRELNVMAPLLPYRVAVTGPRAAGFAVKGDTLEITVITDPSHRPNLEPRLAEKAAAAAAAVPAVQPIIKILSIQQWTQQKDGETPQASPRLAGAGRVTVVQIGPTGQASTPRAGSDSF